MFIVSSDLIITCLYLPLLYSEKEIMHFSYYASETEKWKVRIFECYPFEYLLDNQCVLLQIHPLMEKLKNQAKSEKLWNLFLPQETDRGQFGAGKYCDPTVSF